MSPELVSQHPKMSAKLCRAAEDLYWSSDLRDDWPESSIRPYPASFVVPPSAKASWGHPPHVQPSCVSRATAPSAGQWLPESRYQSAGVTKLKALTRSTVSAIASMTAQRARAALLAYWPSASKSSPSVALGNLKA